MPRSRAVPTAVVLSLLATSATAAPRNKPPTPDAARSARCGAPPPADASWFYLGAPGDDSAGEAAHNVLKAIVDALGDDLPRDPRCLHVEVMQDTSYAKRYGKFGRGGPPAAVTAGFHTRKLGADSTVFVRPVPSMRLDVVMLHEVLHALSHRFTSEADRLRVHRLVEGATDYLTREFAVASLGARRQDLHSGYDEDVEFYAALMERLGEKGLGLLGAAYFTDGYNAFERAVDAQLGINLRTAGRALEAHDLATALHLIRGSSTRAD